jgi:hypothetical protein
MAKRVVVEIEPEITINKTKKIQSLMDGQLIYNGRVSGKHYEWLRAGAIVEVLDEDVPELLSKRLGGNLCCGGSRDGNRIFQVVGD